MKSLVFAVSFISSFLLLYGAFLLGYKTADREVVYVTKEPPQLSESQIKQIGDVSGVFIILPTPTPELIQNRENDGGGETGNVSQNFNLLSEINAYRSARGLTPFSNDTRLCGWVNERLNQLIQRGSLDGHEGFQSQINEFLGVGYTRLAENIGQGFQTSTELVSMWEHSLAHKSTLESTEYSVACADTKNAFGVLIAGSH